MASADQPGVVLFSNESQECSWGEYHSWRLGSEADALETVEGEIWIRADSPEILKEIESNATMITIGK